MQGIITSSLGQLDGVRRGWRTGESGGAEQSAGAVGGRVQELQPRAARGGGGYTAQSLIKGP